MSEQEMDDMLIWKAHDDKLHDHTERIVSLEKGQEDIRSEFREIKDVINRGNQSQEKTLLEQSQKLDTITNRLLEEYLGKKRTTQEGLWKVVAILASGTGIAYVVVDKFLM